MTDYLLIFITVLAAIEVDRLIWDKIREERMMKNTQVRVVKIPKVPTGEHNEEIAKMIKEDLERMINEDDKHQ